jgi:hypothetical protein
MKRIMTIALIAAGLSVAASVRAAENLRLNSRLDYSSDSLDGPLITGDHMQVGALAGKVNYVIIYGEGCFNSKRQARRTVSLYQKVQRPGELRHRRPRYAALTGAAGTGSHVLPRSDPARCSAG